MFRERKQLRLKNYDYSQDGFYYITICVKNRENILGEIIDDKMILNKYGDIVKKYWLKIPKKYKNTSLDEYIIMPNHIHGIISISHAVRAIHELPIQMIHELPIQDLQEQDKKQRRKMLIPIIIGYFKMNTAKQINIMKNSTGNNFWLRNYYEHIIRDELELEKIREYIKYNPLKWREDENYSMR